jgi:hypothetical protein
VLKHCAANRKRQLSALPNVGLYTWLVKIMLTLMDRMDRIRTVVSSVPRAMCVRPVNGTVAGWLLCVKQDGEQVETVL